MGKKILSTLFIFSFLVSLLLAQNSPQDAVLGVWFNAEKDGKIQIYKQADKYYGKLIWMKTPRKDHENLDEKLKSRDLQGVVLLNGFKYTGKSWEDGTIYDPKNGKTYSCIIKSKSANTLDIRGYIGISLIGRTTTWTRTN
ncbi:MAG: DUF2147 domain-containing protein [Bacteroidota bacterium]